MALLEEVHHWNLPEVHAIPNVSLELIPKQMAKKVILIQTTTSTVMKDTAEFHCQLEMEADPRSHAVAAAFGC